MFRLRYGGLLATAALAVAAYLAGALPDGARGIGWQVAGIVAWTLGTAGVVLAWWRVGAGIHRGEIRLRWLCATGALWASPLLLAPPLASRDVYSYACQGALYADGVSPYAYGPAGGGCAWLDSVAPLWRDTPSPYGPAAVALSAAAVWLAALVAPEGYAQLLVTIGALRLLAVASLLLFAWAGFRLARACGVDPLVVAWLGLLSPLVAVHVLSAAHHDGWLAALVLAGLALAADPRTRWAPAVVAGAALGLATAVKVTAVVALPFAVLLVWRGERPRAAAGVVAGAIGGYAAVSWLTGLGLGWVAALPETGRLVQWTSIPTGVGMAAGYGLRALGEPGAFHPAVTAARLIGFAVLVTVLVALWVRAARAAGDTHAVLTCCAFALGAVALLSPVFFPWYAVAAVALLAAVLTDRQIRWRLAAAVAGLSFLILPNGNGLESMLKVPGAIADVVLVSVLAWRHRRAIRNWLADGGRLTVRASPSPP